MSDELLPILVAPGLSLDRIAEVARAAIVQGEVLLALEAAPMEEGLHALELHSSGLAGPLILLGTPVGASRKGETKLRVRPLHTAQAAELDRFISSILPALSPADLVESAPSAPPEGELDTWLQDYLDQASPAPEPAPDTPRGASSQRGEQLRNFLASASALPTLNLVSSSSLPVIPEGMGPSLPPPPGHAQPPITFTGRVDPSPAFLEALAEEAEELEEGAYTEPPRPSTPPGPDLLIGRTLGGKYRIEEVLGQGGMGRVYRAQHLGLGRPVAVKVLHASHAQDPAAVRRFRREALAHSRIEHPNVLRIHDFGEEETGLPYIIMDLLKGQDLRAILDAERVLPMERIVVIMAQVCSALSAAHKQGVVHRDVKPANIMVRARKDEDGNVHEHVVVCDFGLAKAYGPARRNVSWGDSSPLTAIGATVGTPDYLSPEQALGEECDPRTDLYACGAVMYEMATGQVPFATTHLMGLLVAVATKAPRPPSQVNREVHRGLERVILKALSKNRSLRPQSARDLRSELYALVPSLSPRNTMPLIPR